MATVDSSKTRSGAPRGAASQMRCQVITPEKTLMDAEVTFVAVPLIDGEMGILPGRAPVVALANCDMIAPVRPVSGFMWMEASSRSAITKFRYSPTVPCR